MKMFQNGISTVKRFLRRDYISLLFCSILSLSIFYLGLSISPFHSPDSVLYISTVIAIPKQGLIWYFSNWTVSTPLFPLLIASLDYVSGWDPVFSAHTITVLSFALLIFPTFYLGKEIGNEYVGYCSCIFLATSRITWNLSTMIWTEMPFILFSVISILYLVKYIKYKQISFLIIGGVFVALTSLERYVGIFLVISSVLTVFIFEIYLNKQKVWKFLIFLLISSTPIFLLIIRNFIYGQTYYYSWRSRSEPLINLFTETVYFKIKGIFPSLVMADYSAYLFLFIIFLLIILPFFLINYSNISKKEIRNFILITSPLWAYIVVFILFFETFYFAWKGFGEHERLQIVIIPLILIFLFSVFAFNFNVILTKKTHKNLYLVLLIVIFSISFLAQMSSLPQTYQNLNDGLGDFICIYDVHNFGEACSTEDLKRMSINPLYVALSNVWNKSTSLYFVNRGILPG